MRKESDAKSYQIHFLVTKPVLVCVGRLGWFEFPAGAYLYTGSGGRNLEARVARHLSRLKKLRWHIDYLISQDTVQVIGVRRYHEAECHVNQRTAGNILVPRFGATDCRSGCGSHLKYLGAETPREAIPPNSRQPNHLGGDRPTQPARRSE